MHCTVGEAFLGIPAERVFPGLSLLPHARRIGELIRESAATSLLDYGSGKGVQYASLDVEPGASEPRLAQALASLGGGHRSIPQSWGIGMPTCYDPGYPPFARRPAGSFDGVVCTDVLEHCPEEDLEWILADLFGYSRRFLYASISCREAHKRLPDGQNAHCMVRPPDWWQQRFREAARVGGATRYEVYADGVVFRGET